MPSWKYALEGSGKELSSLGKTSVERGAGAFFAALPPLEETEQKDVERGAVLAGQAMAENLLPGLLSVMDEESLSEEGAPLLLLRMEELLPPSPCPCRRDGRKFLPFGPPSRRPLEPSQE